MRKRSPTPPDSRNLVPGRRYRGLHGKVVDWVEHKFEEGDLSDWKSGDFEQVRVFVRNVREPVIHF
jgi:hypothetical protein